LIDRKPKKREEKVTIREEKCKSRGLKYKKKILSA